MKQIFFILLTYICIGTLNAQTASIVDGCAPLRVDFTSPPGATSSYWDFKDGVTSISLNPSNTFLAPNTYVVEYRNSQNGPVINTITITVYPKPVPTFVSDTTMGCAPLTVTFQDVTVINPSLQVTGYSWVFEDGGTAVGKNISHTFADAGSYFVSLEINTIFPSCDVTQQVNNYINTSDRPNVSFTTNPNPPVACTSPLNVAFNNTTSSTSGGLSYRWDLGNGNTSSNTNPPNKTYTVAQAYQVKLVAEDINGCSDSSIRVVSVGGPVPDLDFNDTLCTDERDTIYNFSSGGATWNFNQPGLELHGYYRGLHPIISFETGGTKTIPLRLSAGACFKDTTLTIFVHEVMADFVSSPTYSCSYPATINFSSTSITGPNSTYQWIFDDQTKASDPL